MQQNILAFPKRVVLELTPLCNLSCNMCPRHIIDKQSGYMSEVLWQKLIDEIHQDAPDSIVLPFWRGESLLHKKFIPFSKYALERNIALHISTNGEFLNDKNSPILAQYEFITFSLHTQLGYEKALEFVQKYASDTNTIQASFVDCELSMLPLLDEITTEQDLKGFDAIRLYEEHSKDGLFGNANLALETPRTFCPKLEDTLVVAQDGTISRCNHIWVPESYNLSETSIKEAWHSLRMQEIREHYPDEMCMPCDQWAGNTNGKSWKKEANNIEFSNKGLS